MASDLASDLTVLRAEASMAPQAFSTSGSAGMSQTDTYHQWPESTAFRGPLCAGSGVVLVTAAVNGFFGGLPRASSVLEELQWLVQLVSFCNQKSKNLFCRHRKNLSTHSFG